MMELIKMWPAVLIHRWGLTIAAGFGFLLVGVAVWMATQDRIMLLLSGTVFLLSLGRAALLFRCFVLGNYIVLEGVCVQITPLPLQKCRKVRLLSSDEEELSLCIGRQYTMPVGERYRFYLQRQSGVSLPGTWLAAAFSTGNLLGVKRVEDNSG